MTCMCPSSVVVLAFTLHVVFLAVTLGCNPPTVSVDSLIHGAAPPRKAEVEMALNVFLFLALPLLIRVNTPFCSLEAAHNN